jgi:hypothetical protein
MVVGHQRREPILQRKGGSEMNRVETSQPPRLQHACLVEEALVAGDEPDRSKNDAGGLNGAPTVGPDGPKHFGTSNRTRSPQGTVAQMILESARLLFGNDELDDRRRIEISQSLPLVGPQLGEDLTRWLRAGWQGKRRRKIREVNRRVTDPARGFERRETRESGSWSEDRDGPTSVGHLDRLARFGEPNVLAGVLPKLSYPDLLHALLVAHVRG